MTKNYPFSSQRRAVPQNNNSTPIYHTNVVASVLVDCNICMGMWYTFCIWIHLQLSEVKRNNTNGNNY